MKIAEEMMNRSFLDDLGVAFLTDKSRLLHNYLVHYERFFPEPNCIDTVAEIGVQRGGGKWKPRHPLPSLKMWKEFFPQAFIYGMDLKEIEFIEENVFLMQGDQRKTDDLIDFADFFGQEADLILDDGSHDPYDQIMTFQILQDYVKQGGIYIIEDLNALAQMKYKPNERIHELLKTIDLSGWDYAWIDSASAGKQSSIVMRKKK